MKRTIALAISVASLFAATASAATVTTLQNFANGSVSSSNLGRFSGFLKYSHAANATTATLELSLTNLNTTAAGGKITGFAFNVAGTPSITLGSFSTSSGHSSFGLHANPSQTSPWGAFEYSIAMGSNFNGSGSPNPGITRGNTGVFSVVVSGTAAVLQSLSATTFFSQNTTQANSVSPTPILVRFKGFDGGSSDKVTGIPVNLDPGPTPPGTVNAIPLPSASLASAALLTGLLTRRRR